ncbi:MAG TPA: M13 family metallopeptidase [Candidatus Limnocylindrales bacterium]|nr:M13 family metallopeptidase [Candidatus Limnocylindrales bacterium]
MSSIKRMLVFTSAATLAILLMLVASAPARQSQQSTKPTQSTRAAPKPATPPAAQTPSTEYHAFDVADMDRTCKPCEDFYHFVNGGWMSRNPIPAAYPVWGRINELNNHNQDVLRKILEEAAANKTAVPGSIEQKIGDYYATCMDTAKIDGASLHHLDEEFARIAQVSDLASLQAEVAHLRSIGARPMFAFGSEQDFKDSSEQIGATNQGGLGLPDRDYYTKTDDASVKLRDGYSKHLAKMFTLMGDTAERSGTEAATVMAIETQLAKASRTRVELRDPESNYHRMSIDELGALTPHFNWPAFFTSIGFPGIRVVNASQPDYLKSLDAMLTSVSIEDWKTYLRWHLIHASAPYLSAPFVDENFDFFGKTLTGTTEQLPRWKRCVAATDRQLGEALGQKYVAVAFPPEAKARALEIVHNLIAALRDDLQTLPWMSQATRLQAMTKLNAFTLKIGYPDTWRDYSDFHVDRTSYVLNYFHGSRFDFRYDLAKIGKPVDHGEWIMTPPTVNAYYNPQLNEIVFPAGILQPPLFDAKADDALNYGAMGSVIGHEMTHGFDDQGRQFDATGNLRDWWTPEDAKNFQERALCVQKQFDTFVVSGDLHENGKLVLGESIGDLGGLAIAHAAFRKSQEGKPQTSIDGFTPDQRFFMAFTRDWGENIRPEFEKLLTNTDVHPLPRFRAVAPLMNMPEFAKAFDCKAGDSLVRAEDQRCRIW